jgi:hypothetical protein
MHDVLIDLDRFRWAALQIEELKLLHPMKPRNINQALQLLPRDLDETYERILVRVPAGNAQEALSALNWVTFATRPLFIEELIEICAIHLESDPEFDKEERYLPGDILDLLPGLLTITPVLKASDDFMYSTHVVTFAHFSVHEYLLRDRILSSPARDYAIDPQYSNSFIASCCLAYLSCCNTFQLHKDSYALRGYAWDFWAWHTVWEIGKSKQELSTKAEELFNSIAQSDPSKIPGKFDNLRTLLSPVAEWRALSYSRQRQFERSLRFPFFYPEFDSARWEEASASGQSSSLHYQYEQLPQDIPTIRLIELFPSRKKFPEVRCRMFSVSLDSNPKYEGVSFYWGGQRDTSFLRVNGLALEAPKSIVSDLRNLRNRTDNTSRILFADAPCFDIINHHQLEHNLRTTLMPQIFKQAQQVAIGLGDSHKDDASAIDLVGVVSSMSGSGKNLDKYLRELRVDNKEEDWEECMGKSVLRLFQRPWWRRIWPVQELILPSKATLYYGGLGITFDTFQRFFEMEEVVKKFLGATIYSEIVSERAWIGAQRVSSLRTQYMQGQSLTLPELLWATQFHQSHHRATKVYSLKHLLALDEQRSKHLVWDKIPAEEEYFTAVSVHILKTYRNLDILSYAAYHRWDWRVEQNKVATWVPDFGMDPERIDIELKPLINGDFGPSGWKDLYNAGKQEKLPSLNFSVDLTQVTVQGIRVDTVIAVYGILTDEEPKDHMWEIYEALQRSEVVIIFPKSQSVLEAFWRTLCIDQYNSHRIQDSDIPSTVSNFVKEAKGNTEVIQGQLEFDLRHCKKMQLFSSSQGYICLGPAYAEIGDLIAVMPGGKVPYILRKSGENFIFIGEWSVHPKSSVGH